MKYEERNHEFRTIPGVDPRIRVSRDGEVQINGRDERPAFGSTTALDGTLMTLQMCIYKAFPDIPMRYTPTLPRVPHTRRRKSEQSFHAYQMGVGEG